MGNVYYAPTARAHLEDIWRSVFIENPRAADNLIRRIVKRIETASEQPGMGSPRPYLSPRARILVEGRYVVIYEPVEGARAVNVLAVVHGMRDPASWLDG
jgi:toxin ParE1/3/4